MQYAASVYYHPMYYICIAVKFGIKQISGAERFALGYMEFFGGSDEE